MSAITGTDHNFEAITTTFELDEDGLRRRYKPRPCRSDVRRRAIYASLRGVR